MLRQACTRECRRGRPRSRCVLRQRRDHADVAAHGPVLAVTTVVIWH